MFKRVIILFSFITALSFSTEIEFKKIYSNTLRFEGKTYIKNKVEESKYGISNYYTENVKALTEDSAYEIAYKKIYKAHRLGEIKDKKVRAFVFDWIYNSAPRGAIKRIQEVLHVNVTGCMNTETINSLNNFEDTDLLIQLLKEKRINYLRTLKTYQKYKNGWELRVATIV